MCCRCSAAVAAAAAAATALLPANPNRLQGFPGHKDAVTSLAFREGTHELFRCGSGAGLDWMFGQAVQLGRRSRVVQAAAAAAWVVNPLICLPAAAARWTGRSSCGAWMTWPMSTRCLATKQVSGCLHGCLPSGQAACQNQVCVSSAHLPCALSALRRPQSRRHVQIETACCNWEACACLPCPAEVLALDAARAERCVSCGADRTCRIWKIPEESQLIFR